MFIKFSPQVSDKKLVVTKKGDALTINGEVFDFTGLPEGGLLPNTAISSEYIVGTVFREAGKVNITLLLPISIDAPSEATFPTPLVDPLDGELKLPKGTNV